VVITSRGEGRLRWVRLDKHVKKKVTIIFGTRPEAIKLAPVVRIFRGSPDFSCEVCVTAQHREMLDQVLEVFDIRPDIDLDLMNANQSLAGLTARAVSALDDFLSRSKPDLVLVQGDTTTSFCAALSAFYRRIPVGHVEAGLRTGNLEAPWPEEANRQLTARLAVLHFTPTETGRRNLLREGVPPGRIFITGNTVVDALLLALNQIRSRTSPLPELSALNAKLGDSPMVLITGHRRESFGGGFRSICSAVAELACRFPGTHFVYPVHLNPNVREPVHRILGSLEQRNVHLMEPLPYLAFVALMDRSALILTDSGGIQEEAPTLGKPVLVMRDTTERPEAIEAGTARLVGTRVNEIVSAASALITDAEAYAIMACSHNPYGDGRAAERILTNCAGFFKEIH